MPWQCADLPALGLDADRARRAVQWVGTDGVRAEGETAVAGALRTAGRAGQFAAAAILAARPVSGWVYRWVSEHRGRLPGGPPACRGPHA